MRRFLPIKGPGGRALTPKEAVALVVLGITLVLCVLTLLAGEKAYVAARPQNPIFALVSALGRTMGGGIVAFYGLVLVWSGLIYFRGEKIARVTPVGGRLAAALCVALALSGALGIAQIDTAGSLGLVVGTALGNTFGGVVGVLLLLALMALGINLAGQGAWAALRGEPAMAAATASAAGPYVGKSSGFGFGQPGAPAGRLAGEPQLPDDGDPTPDERSFAVTQAMEEIERSQGVRIVDVDRDEEVAQEEPVEEEIELARRPSIGEEVASAPAPAPETEEAIIQRRLREIGVAMQPPAVVEPDAPADAAEEATETVVRDEDDEEAYLMARHGFVPVPAEVKPAAPAAPEDGDEVAEVEAAEVEAAEVESAEREIAEAELAEAETTETETVEPEVVETGYAVVEVAANDVEPEEDDEDAPARYAVHPEDLLGGEAESYLDPEDDPEDDAEEQAALTFIPLPPAEKPAAEEEPVRAWSDDEQDAEPAEEASVALEEAPAEEAGFAVAVEDDEEEPEAVEEEPAGDPFARSQLVLRFEPEPRPVAEEDFDRPYTSFDWRGRPLD